MSLQIAIEAEYLPIIRDILARHLPANAATYVFGSRATGERLKPWSDLDLAVEGPGPLEWGVLPTLEQAFDEALVPWKVDIIDLNAVSPEFREIVDRQKVPLPLADR